MREAPTRLADFRTAIKLELATVIWMVVETAAAVGAGIAAGSLLLVAFGIDSGIELLSAIVVFRRFRLEFAQVCLTDNRKLERTAACFAGYLLFLLSLYVVVQAIFGLINRHAAETSWLGIAVAVVAAIGMPLLAKAKLRVAVLVGSRSLRADAMETIACGYMAWALLIGLALNAVTRWWWVDSVASLAIVPLLIREGREVISGEPAPTSPNSK